jgi:hypothetical protein
MPFAASWEWFNHFKCRHAFHNLKITGEAAATDHVAAKELPTYFKAAVVEGGYTPKQSNLSETALFNEHDSDLMKSSKMRMEIENALKCYKVSIIRS